MMRLLVTDQANYFKVMHVFHDRFRGRLSLGVLPDLQMLFFRMNEDNFIVDEIYNDQVYEQYFRPLKGDVVADVGAHIGIFTLKAAKHIGKKGIVLAFEPEKTNFWILQLNTKVNNLHQVKTFMLGLGEKEKYAQLFLDSANSGGHSLCFHKTQKFCKIKLAILDKVVENYASGKLDFLKVDVEGYELNVLKGARKSLTKNSVKVAIAAYHYIGEAHKIVHFLDELGYETKIWFNQRHEPFVFAQKVGLVSDGNW
jgi:FkbM family methyltransferase